MSKSLKVLALLLVIALIAGVVYWFLIRNGTEETAQNVEPAPESTEESTYSKADDLSETDFSNKIDDEGKFFHFIAVAQSYADEESYDKALAAVDEALTFSDDLDATIEAEFAKAYIYQLKGDTEAYAQAQLRLADAKALKFEQNKSKYANIGLQAANTYYDVGEKGKASDIYKKLLALDDKDLNISDNPASELRTVLQERVNE